jgi:hypothetical protein
LVTGSSDPAGYCDKTANSLPPWITFN